MSRYREVVGLAEEHARSVSESPENWMGYLDTAARLYRYPFMDSLLIHAQRPNATACAELPMWNNRMYRWVNRGAKGIALIDRSGRRPGVRYVFDVEDTHPVRGARDPIHWSIKDGYEDRLIGHLKSEYGLEEEDTGKLAEALIAIAGEKAEAAIGELYQQIAERYPSVLPEETDDVEGNELYELMESSMAYMLLSRCGLDPLEYLDADEFSQVSEYARPFVIASIGSAVQKAAKEVLQDIGITVFRIQREEQKKAVEYQFNRQEMKNIEGEDISHEHGDRLPEERGLSVSSGEERTDGDAGIDGDRDREVREDEGELPGREQEQPVSGTTDQRGTGRASGGSSEVGGEEDGRAGGGDAGEVSGTGQGGYDSVDSTYERSDGDGGGDREERDRLRIETENVAALSLPVFPSMEEQRRQIEERVTMLYAGNSLIAPEVVDAVLRTAGNKENSIYRIIYDFMIEQPEESHRDFVKQEYGTGGKGLLIDGQSYSVWFDENGMEFASGRSVHDNLLMKGYLSWDEVSRRIHQLLLQGEYADQDVLDKAKEAVFRESAATLVNIVDSVRDKETASQFFTDMEMFEGRYDDRIDRALGFIMQEGNLTKLVTRLEKLDAAVKEDPGIMRYGRYRSGNYVSEFSGLAMEAVPFQARDGFIVAPLPQFVTQDEMDRFYLNGIPNYGGGRTEVYAFFCQNGAVSERAKFIRGRFGIAGGASIALSGYAHFGFNYDGKGLEFYKRTEGMPDYREKVRWNEVSKRIGYLIDEGRYLTAEEHARLPEYEREEMAKLVVKFYAYLPEEIERPFTNTNEITYGEMIDGLALDLAIPVESERLFAKMADDLKHTILDTEDEWALERVDILTTIRNYIDGKYSIYNRGEVNQGIVDDREMAEDGSEDSSTPLRSARNDRGDDEGFAVNEAPKQESMQLSIFDYMDAREAEEPKLKSIVIDISGEHSNPVGGHDGHGDTETEIRGHDDHTETELEPSGHDGHRDIEAESGLSVVEPFYPMEERVNFRITDDDLGAGGPKQKYHANMEAIMCLKQIEMAHRLATPEEQEILSKYVGWGGIPHAFDSKNAQWSAEYEALKSVLTQEEYRAARASTLNAFYTSPTVIKAMYDALSNMGLSEGNVLEPSCGAGNFMGLLPESMQAVNMYGVELDSLTGRIARQLYQRNSIAVKGFEKTELPDNFFDTVIGNVPFGEYQVVDPNYDRHHFLIHDYFIARSIDLVRPGGVIAVVTSAGTMDKKDESARRYFAQRADLLGAIRLPNNAFLRNANTGVVADILFFQKRDRAMLEEPEWVHTKKIEGGKVNAYFASHPEMVLGEFTTENTQYGNQELTVKPYADRELSELLAEAVAKIQGTIPEIELPEMEEGEQETSIPADPKVRNYSYAVVENKVYFRENSRMYEQKLPKKTEERIKGMVGIRDLTRGLLQAQLEDSTEGVKRVMEQTLSDTEIHTENVMTADEMIGVLQEALNKRYDAFVKENGLISSNANKRAFAQDSGYSLILALEVIDENGELVQKADIFTKRTIRKAEAVTSVDTASEALAVSIGEKAGVDLAFMSQLTGKSEDEITEELRGVIFMNPLTRRYETADEYLSGNVRNKLRTARTFAASDPAYEVNVAALEQVQPKDLDASEIEVRLGAPWVKSFYIEDFMTETFQTPKYLMDREIVGIHYSEAAGTWGITGKTADRSTRVTTTYGTSRASAYRLLEDALNLKDTKIYDTIEEDGKEKRVLNKKETMLAQQKQEMIREEFKNWIFKDIERREDICSTYNEIFNSVRPREYDGSHIRFYGMNPEIALMQHQKNAIAHVLYGKNTLLAHCVGSGKTFEITAAAMESKRLGMCRKSLIVVPNHLTEQWGSEFLRLYPGANILVATKKDFEPANRKRFCSRISTGDYDAIIIGHTQFEKIPLSTERRRMSIERQIDELEYAIEEAGREDGSQYTVKQLEKMRANLETKLERMNDTKRKDDVVTFEELGVDRLFVDESQNFKNMFLYTKMRNVAGISQTDAQKSSDMFMKCQYLDEITGGRGVTFATGTPISNSMVELYTLMRYLQYDKLQEMNLLHFDSWAASFGETVNSVELTPEGNGYRSKTRFARFFNLPELMSVFKEAADVQTEDMLDLPVPELESITEVIKPSEIQKEMVQSYGERAEKVRSGSVDPRDDNMLKITNDGRKCALDQRLLNPDLPDEPESKVNRCVENVAKIWEETMEDRSTQLIFCDMSTPKGDGSFNVYDDIRNKLVERGIPREEVAFIHEYNTEAKKAELFKKVRSGQVRVLLGSTQKLGAGTNVQDRLIALHHLDCPWRPSDLQQQNGRILRQGNRNPKVKIFQYVTEGTFDAFMWQILEQKQKFISQIMTSKSPVRSCEDVDTVALGYAEVKALCTGNPLIKKKMELQMEMSKLRIMRSNYTSVKYNLESDIAYKYPAKIHALTERIQGMRQDIEKTEQLLSLDKEQFVIEIGGVTYTERKEAGEALIAACNALPSKTEGGKVGSYHGFELSAKYEFFSNAYTMDIKGECTYRIELGKDPSGNMTRIRNAIAAIPKELEREEQRLESTRKDFEAAKEEVAKPFAREEEYQAIQARIIEVDAMLSVDLQEENAVDVDESMVDDREMPVDGGEDSSTPLRSARNDREVTTGAAQDDREGGSARNDMEENRPSLLGRLREKQRQISHNSSINDKTHDMDIAM